jgi:hypothetical protein
LDGRRVADGVDDAGGVEVDLLQLRRQAITTGGAARHDRSPPGGFPVQTSGAKARSTGKFLFNIRSRSRARDADKVEVSGHVDSGRVYALRRSGTRFLRALDQTRRVTHGKEVAMPEQPGLHPLLRSRRPS